MTYTGITLQHVGSKAIRELAFDKNGKPVLTIINREPLRHWNPENWRHYEREDLGEPSGPYTLAYGAGG